MIYAYRHLPHKIEGLNTEIEYFFNKLFENNLETYDDKILLTEEFIITITTSQKFKTYLKEITETYFKLDDTDKQTLKDAFKNNLPIEMLCSDPACASPIKFAAIKNEAFRKLLKDFLTGLWEDYPIIDAIENKYGLVQDHFSDFIDSTHQKAYVCPFCGLHKLKPSGGIKRDAYDHYIPKAFYPFVSINYLNLFPICHECNSDEKKATDTLFDGNNRRRVFYPFDTTYQPNQLSIVVEPEEKYSSLNFKTLLQDIKWKYKFTYAGNDDPRLESWDKIFRVKGRYRENILHYQIEWFGQLCTKYKRELRKGTNFQDFKKEILDDAKDEIYSSPLGILRYVYFTFLFSIEDFEEKLSNSVA